ncbi:hypothetical protein GGR55DRAFT_650587 [Xylaria sp. FL0064]|nr:hypothetical protein GGR55DRAFT_650587 [Xylaria sp. FL0064]
MPVLLVPVALAAQACSFNSLEVSEGRLGFSLAVLLHTETGTLRSSNFFQSSVDALYLEINYPIHGVGIECV